MNVLILGRNEINEALAACIEERGWSPAVIEDAGSVKSFRGECGDFKIKAGADEITAAAVIITEPPEKNTQDICGGAATSIFNDQAMKDIAVSGTKNPVIILLDYFNDSSTASTVKGLKEAIAFASKKLNVIVIFRFMRTAGMETEELYSEARNMGVTFIKYESLNISYNGGEDVFNVEVSDGINDVSLSTKFIITDSGYGAAEGFSKLAGKLRLKANEAGYLNEDRYFLNPALTSRKGVYCLNRDVCSERIREAVDYFISDAAFEVQCGSAEKNHAVVDGEKCAFCYTCYRACPHAAMAPDEEERVMKNNNAACESCGTCAAICPGNAIKMSGDTFSSVYADRKSGKIKIFCCENSGDVALRNILPGLGEQASRIDYETVPCGGRIGFEQMSGALRTYGKVMVLVCMDGACRHFDGNKRVCLHSDRLASMLEKAGADSGRVCVIKTSHAMENVLRDSILEEIK